MPKSKNEKKKAAAAAGKAPKLTKQQENAGKSAKQKKADKQVRDRWCFFFQTLPPPPFRKLNKNIIALHNCACLQHTNRYRFAPHLTSTYTLYGKLSTG